MKIGVTGTRQGMTEAQVKTFKRLLSNELKGMTEFHHGDCQGADTETANIVYLDIPSVEIICHPPIDQSHRAFNNKHSSIREPKTHFARNRDIVNETDYLVVIPLQSSRQRKGGTWYTCDYALKLKNKMIWLIWPDGTTWVWTTEKEPIDAERTTG